MAKVPGWNPVSWPSAPDCCPWKTRPGIWGTVKARDALKARGVLPKTGPRGSRQIARAKCVLLANMTV